MSIEWWVLVVIGTAFLGTIGAALATTPYDDQETDR